MRRLGLREEQGAPQVDVFHYRTEPCGMPSGFRDPTLPCMFSSIFKPQTLPPAPIRRSGLQVVLWPTTHLPIVFIFIPLNNSTLLPNLGMPSLATTKVSWCLWFTVLTKVANFMGTLRDRTFTVASSAMIALPQKPPHRQRRAVLRTASYLPIKPLRANLQGKDPVHLLPKEVSQRQFCTR